MTGSQEVSGSIPLISTTKNLEAETASRFFHVYDKLHKAVFVLNFVLNYKFFAISFISLLVVDALSRPANVDRLGAILKNPICIV